MKQNLVYVAEYVFEILVISTIIALMLYLEPKISCAMTHRILSKIGIAGLHFTDYHVGTGFIVCIMRLFKLSIFDTNSRN